MALLLPNSVFFHTPKTAGQWVAEAIENSGIPVEQIGVVHSSPDEMGSDPRVKGIKHRFTFVRHPLTWYQSMWAHRMDEEWDAIDAVEWFSQRWIAEWEPFTSCRSSDFCEFVYRVLDRFPNGWVSHLYRTYTETCTVVARQERIIEELLNVLELTGEDYDPGRITATKPRNVRGSRPFHKNKAVYTQSLIERVMDVEKYAIERFDYHEVPPELIFK